MASEAIDREVWPVVVIGAGAAGLTAAIFAARQGARVLILETRAKPGAKIRVSGGGRCNVLPSEVELGDFHTSGSERSMRNVLFSWPLESVRAFFEDELDIALKVEDTGKVFPQSEQPREIVDALLDECATHGATLRAPFRVAALSAIPVEDDSSDKPRFEITEAEGERVLARRVILATGGLSLPRTGSDGAGFEIAAALDHDLAPRYPALVPLLSDDARFTDLSGLSVEARITAEARGKELESRSGALLFTHRGFSGPVVLDMSRFSTCPLADGETRPRLRVSWLARPGKGGREPDWDGELKGGGKTNVVSVLRSRLPRRLAETVLAIASVDGETKLAALPKDARRRLVEALSRHELPIDGDEGYATAEVTAGGVPLSEVVLKTLESRKVPGLHFAGEILDVVGRIGGYNFLWAWVSGRKAGEGAASGESTRSC